jgi:hypothetical protein
VVIADAKYRSDGMRASQSSRRDLMSYMNAFGLARSVVFFLPKAPSPPNAETLGYGGLALIEIPITPIGDLVEQLALTLPTVLESSAQIPTWH